MEVIKIKDLPELERPREKARHFGINKLSNTELLTLIIGSGGKDLNAIMIAQNLLAYAKSIDRLLKMNFREFLKVNGIKEATAFRFVAMSELIKRQGLIGENIDFVDSNNIANRYRYIIGGNKNESMYLIAINDKGNVIFEKELYIGTSKTLVSSEEEIINELNKENAHFFVIVHNHPSNNINPSFEDINSTNHLYLKALDNNLILLDHLIVSNTDEYYSFKDNGHLLK